MPPPTSPRQKRERKNPGNPPFCPPVRPGRGEKGGKRGTLPKGPFQKVPPRGETRAFCSARVGKRGAPPGGPQNRAGGALGAVILAARQGSRGPGFSRGVLVFLCASLASRPPFKQEILPRGRGLGLFSTMPRRFHWWKSSERASRLPPSNCNPGDPPPASGGNVPGSPGNSR